MAKTTPLPAGAPLPQMVPIINKNFAELDQPLTLYNDQNGIPNISIGLQPDGTSRIRVANTGVDVTTATDDQLAFNSAQDTLKVRQTGTYTLTRPSGTSIVTQTVAHGLSYVPILMYNVEQTTVEPGVWRLGLAFTADTATGAFMEYFTASVDATNIYFKCVAPTGTGYLATTHVGTFKYYLLQQPATA